MNIQPSVTIPFPDLPEGTVTFLFTDIEGSTQLLARLRDKYAILLADHHRILREAFSNWDGHEVDTQGDAFFVAFSRATQAVGAAAEAQRKLNEHVWPERVDVQVRMGIHTGESWTGSEGYVGMDVHRAARIAHVGNGGQVLLSETTTALVQDELPPGVSLLDLGRHLLKDIHRPERIHQLVIEGLPSEFPPLTSLEVLPPDSARQPRKVGMCPYRGLSAFQEADAPFYFGRETFIDALERTINTKKLVAVIVGSSGSGKSSALFAGLLPRLRRTGSYQFAIFRPGVQPFYAMAGALLPLLEPGLSKTDLLAETRKLAEGLTKGEVLLAQVIDRIREDSPDTRQILLVVDQFEELYTLCPDANLQKSFIDALLSIVEAVRGRHNILSVILLTMRADFMGQALSHRPFADALQEGSLLMGPMTRLELHMAIEKPAEMQGAAFEPGLVERILDDVGDKPGNLPLLEFTLTQLWEQQTDGWLTHADYEVMGGLEGALAAYADRVYDELGTNEQERGRRAMVQLVQPGEGTEDTRRIATRDELGEESWNLIQRLADRRLVVTGRDAQGYETAEVVHEALIQKWGRFREWMDTDRAFRLWQERLRSSLRQWQESEQDKGALLSGTRLSVAQEWLTERGGDLSRAEMEYILASEVEQQALQEAEAARQKREVALTRRARNFLFALVAILLVAVIGTSGLAYVARQAQGDAEHQTDLARARELSLAALNNIEVDPELSILLGLQSASVYTMLGQTLPNDLQSTLHQAIQASRVQMTWEAGNVTILAAEFTQPGDSPRVLTYNTERGTITLWDPAANQKLLEIPIVAGDQIKANLSHDGSLAAFSENNVIRLWDVNAGHELKIISNDSSGILGLVFSPDNENLLTWSLTKYTLREIASGSIRLDIPNQKGDRRVAVFSPDGKLIAARTPGNTISIFDSHSGKSVTTIALQPNFDAIALAFNPDGTRLAGTGRATDCIIWDVQTGETILSFDITHGPSAGAEIKVLAYSPDGTWLALPGVIYDAISGKALFFLLGPTKVVSSLEFNRDGTHLITASDDQTVKIWNLTPSHEVLTISHPTGGFIYGVAFNPDEKWLVTTGADKTARVWELDSGKLIQTLEGHTDFVNSVAFSPDGNLLATGSADRSIIIWDKQSWRILRVLTGYGEDKIGVVPVIRGVVAIAFSPQCKSTLTPGYTCLLAGVGMDGQLIVWDALTGQKIYNYQDLEGGLKSLAFSPDGKLLAIGTTGVLATPIGVVKLLDATTGNELHTFQGEPNSWVWDVTFSPDGSRLAAIYYLGLVKIWNLNTYEIELTLTDLSSGNSLAFDPTGSYLVTAGNATIGVWDARTGKPLFKLSENAQTPNYSTVFSPDGKYLATTNLVGTARVYVIPPEALVAFARTRLTRGFTLEECQQYLHVDTCPASP